MDMTETTDTHKCQLPRPTLHGLISPLTIASTELQPEPLHTTIGDKVGSLQNDFNINKPLNADDGWKIA